MDVLSQLSSPPEVPARSPLRNSTTYQTTEARSSSQPQYEGEANSYVDERHYTALSRSIDHVLDTIGSGWPLTPMIDQGPHHDHGDDTGSSVYSESLISEDDFPLSTPELCSRVPSIDATYGCDGFPPTPTESWSSDTPKSRQEELWTATERLHIRHDSIADDNEESEHLPMITTEQMFGIIENLPRRLDTYSPDVDKRRVDYEVPFLYSKGPCRKIQKDDSIQLLRAGSRSQQHPPSLMTRTSSIRNAAKRLLTL